MEKISLRDANAGDEAFLEELFFDVRGDEFAIACLPREQLQSLLEMQFASQKLAYERSFPDTESLIIEIEGHHAGRLLITQNAEKIHLIDISILRDFRGNGVGSFVLDTLKSKADTIVLRVIKTNLGAIKLYERHGYRIVSENDGYFEMEWKNA